MRILFVGIHNKPNTSPLDSKTKSGKLIDKMIINLKEDICTKTNLFDCENIPEKDIEEYKTKWIEKYKPSDKDIIVLLGNNVKKLFPDNVSSKIIKIKHPSSIWSKESQKEYVKDFLEEIIKLKNN